jgi:hypothetical protein
VPRFKGSPHETEYIVIPNNFCVLTSWSSEVPGGACWRRFLRLVARKLQMRSRKWTGACLAHGHLPVPLSATPYGLFGSGLVLIITVAARVPFAAGVNATEYEHRDVAARLLPQVLAAVIAKSPGFVPFKTAFNEIDTG